MSRRELGGKYLLDADVFIAFIRGDELSDSAEKVVEGIVEERVRAVVSSMLYDDIISGLRSKGMSLEGVRKVLVSVAAIPHESLPVTPALSVSALQLYERYGGPRKLHYFDSYHVATSRLEDIPLITSDSYILDHREDLGIRAEDLSKL
ncbi:MAG: PIN domain-containing protein [Candidatus Hadarchaeota archaeon]|nr:PIN domain-containing protein [Candidatus Hadarchaeota archaeon]